MILNTMLSVCKSLTDMLFHRLGQTGV